MRILATICLWVLSAAAWADERSPLTPEPHSLFLRVIDTGSGTATLTIISGAPGTHRKVMIYDAGHWNDDALLIDELKHYLGQRKTINVMVISHSDSDHLGGADTVLKYWKVRKNVRTGWEGNRPGTYWAFRRALEDSVADNGTEDFVIGNGSPAHGETWALGDAQITFLSGFAALPAGWDVGVPPSNEDRFESKSRNAVSIVVRLTYGDRAILFGGDAVGRTDKAPWSQNLGTEKYLLDHSAERPIAADIILAPHHGADNASALPFITAVNPSWVIFSAGVHHKHPKFNTFRRYERIGVPVSQILRTDRGDEKGRADEWWGDWDDSCRDGHGDDGISILIPKGGAITVDQDPPADPALGC